jgi:subtilisin family serine protease
LDPALFRLVDGIADDAAQRFPVSIWLKTATVVVAEDRPVWLSGIRHSLSTPEASPKALTRQVSDVVDRPSTLGSIPTSGQILASLQAESARVQSYVAAAVSPFCALLAQRDWVIDYGSRYVPVVYATLSKAAILEVQELPDVDSISLLRSAANAMDVASAATNAHWVWEEGYSGLGVKVGVIEVGGRAAIGNPYLRGVVQDEQNVPDEEASHGTAVLGMIRGRHSSYRGIGYGAQVRVGGCTGGDVSQLNSAAERALTWGARVLNNSWGTFAYNYKDNSSGKESMTDQERYWDSLVNLHRATIVFAAGNEGDEHGFLRHPGYAYNLIAVAGYDDKGTERWADDTMASFSSYKDCESGHGDREKPELAAPGVGIYATITQSPWVGSCGNGTSYASPIVAGGVTLLMQQTPELYAWPEAVKAILMASAWNNIEDNVSGDWYMGGRDGAGGVDLYEAMYVARLRHWGAGEWTTANFDANGYTYIPIELPVAAKARGVIVWSVDPNYSDYVDQPQVDLDLDYRMANGEIISRSESYDNNFEVVWANQVSGGTRYLAVRAERFEPNVRVRVAWAWDWRTE